MKKSVCCDVSVIGAGPAGMMAAYQASLRGLSVRVYDPNRFQGRKLRITGKGRCNVCNNCDTATVMKNIPGDGRFLYSALSRFGPSDVISFFESNGVPLKTERGMRVFPVSDRADDIADCMVRLCKGQGVEFVNSVIKSLDDVESDYIILATGGCSYPLTGSNGNGYRLAESAGHRIITPRPSLVPLESSDDFCAELQGFSPKNVVFTLYSDNKKIYSEMGEMLFTHFGISGPLVLSASAHMRDTDASYRAEIDFKPALDHKKLDLRILRDFEENPNKAICNVLPGLTGTSMAPVVLKLCDIPPETRCNSITHAQRSSVRTVLKAFPVSICGTRPIDEAIITAGGVDTKEVNPRTMQSKIDSRLYFAGEILNLDAYTGGFNLQIAWSTGFVAGQEVGG